MGEFKLGRMTLKSLFSKPATVSYPVEPREYFPATKGHVVIEIDRCRFDGSCAVLCPTGALEVDREALTWGINRFKCIQCRNCIEVCMENALTMDNAYAPSASVKTMDVYTLSDDARAKREAAEAEKRERAAKLREAAAAKKRAEAEAAKKEKEKAAEAEAETGKPEAEAEAPKASE